MGCGGSVDQKGKERGKPKAEEPELNGKVKFLGCPVVSEIFHQETKHRWFLIAFAPQTHHGLIIAARNYNTGELLAKDVPDSELIKEKEWQGITLSWNLFFKAISTEISKASKAGAKWEITPEKTMKLEIKISIAGAQTNKKVDSYNTELTPVPSTPENLFRFFMEPIATYYGKKRTDLLDRPDPVKERQYGECEANAILKNASIEKHQKFINEFIPVVGPLRAKNRELSQDGFEKGGKLLLMQRMLQENTLKPSLLKADLIDSITRPPVCEDGTSVQLSFLGHLDSPLFTGCLMSIALRTGVDESVLSAVETLIASVSEVTIESRNSPLLRPALPSDIEGPTGDVWRHLEAFDGPHYDSFSADALEAASSGHAVYLTSLFMFYRYGIIGHVDGLDTEKLKNFLYAAEQIYQRTGRNNTTPSELPPNTFHTQQGLCQTLHCLHWMLSHGGALQGLGLQDPNERYVLVLAAIVHDLDHPGVNNPYLTQSLSYLAVLYNQRSPLERHHVAVAIELSAQPPCNVPLLGQVRADLLQVVLATDMSRHTEVLERFEKRANQISDWTRTKEDRLHAAQVLLKAADSFYLMASNATCKAWSGRVRDEFFRQGDLHVSNSALIGVALQESMDRRKYKGELEFDRWNRSHETFGYYVVLPTITALAQAFPGLASLREACSVNVNETTSSPPS